jgi:hypothetical protein
VVHRHRQRTAATVASCTMSSSVVIRSGIRFQPVQRSHRLISTLKPAIICSIRRAHDRVAPSSLSLGQPLARHFSWTSCTAYSRNLPPSPTQKSTPEDDQTAEAGIPTTASPTDTSPVLRENIYTIPNLLTVSRILACPVIGYAILHDNFYLSTTLLAYASFSDYVSTIYFVILTQRLKV